jgi:hypothetical protein
MLPLIVSSSAMWVNLSVMGRRWEEGREGRREGGDGLLLALPSGY